MGKVIGGGLPVGACGGRKDIMEFVAPAGSMYQAGTLSGNPLAMRAGIETLKKLSQPGVHAELERKSKKLVEGIVAAAEKHGHEITGDYAGGMLDGTLHPVRLRILLKPRKQTQKSSASGTE